MEANSEISAPAAGTAEELTLYRKYLDTLSGVAAILLEETNAQNWTEVLRLLAETTHASWCGLFLNEPLDHDRAKLRSTWSSSAAVSRLSEHLPLREIRYTDNPWLSDTLHAGMVLIKDVAEMPPQEAGLFGRQDIRTVLIVPLLVGGEAEGFIGLFSLHRTRHWAPLEINVLCAVANGLALSLVRNRAEASLRASATRLRALVGATEDAVIECDRQGRIVHAWSGAGVIPLGREEALVGMTLEQALPNDMAHAIRLVLPIVLAGGGREAFEFTLNVGEQPRFFLGWLQTLPSEQGETPNVVALVRDVTALMQEEARRRTMLETLDLLDEAIIDLSPQGRLINASAAWDKLLATPRQSVPPYLGKPLLAFAHPDDQGALDGALRRLGDGGKAFEAARFRLMQKDGNHIWVEARLLAHRNPRGEVSTLRGILRDITSGYLQERRIMQLALHDALTGLPNRILLEDHLQQAISRAQRKDTKVALGFIDLDHFKHINDTLGHKAGDTVLVTLSKRLQAVLREVDTLSRWGGDEFVVLLPDTDAERDVRAVAERLRDAARQSINLGGVETKLTISIGFALYPDDADSADTLMSVADHTMFHAKGVGRNNVQFFRDVHDKGPDRENVLLQTRLSQAVQDRQIQVFYQPILDTANGQVMGFEALARWHDEHNGWISPDVFIPMAEHLGIIRELGEQVFDHALERLKGWRELGLPVRVSVNLSRVQLFAPQFVAGLVGKVARHGLKPNDLILEITESVALLDFSYESKRLQELAAAGFSIAIDDFGTGYSALAHLHQMPVDILKIDASFTSRLDTDDGRRIVQAIAQMADALGLKMVVEGVEDAHTVHYLQGLGIYHMQGIHFSDAVPAGLCQTLIQQSPTLFK